MPQLVTLPPPAYAPKMAKRAAAKGDGPWGEAIQFWFKEKHVRQSHVVEATGMPPNKVSRAFNGLNVRPDTLRQIAEFLQVPFEHVLVSPMRRLGADVERMVAEKLAAEARRVMERSRPTAATKAIDPRLLGIARRIDRLPAGLQKSVLQVITDYEKIAKKSGAKGGGGGGKPPKKT